MFHSIFPTQGQPSLFHHAAGVASPKTSPQVGVSTGDEVVRVRTIDLERAWRSDPLAYNIVRKYTLGVMQKNVGIATENDNDKAALEEINRRLKLRSEVIPTHVKDMVTFGSGWNEKRLGMAERDDDKKLLRLITRDAKFMDISKIDTAGTVIPLTDNLGEPQYYVQYLQYHQEASLKFKSRKIQQNNQPAIKFFPNEIFHTSFITIGDMHEGLGIIEPIYEALRDKKQIQRDAKHGIRKFINPIIYGVAGNERVHPTQPMIDALGNMIVDVLGRTGWAIPNYGEIKVLEPSEFRNPTEYIKYYNDEIIAGSGMTEALVMGRGEGSNKHTLAELMKFLMGDFTAIRNSIRDSFDSQVIPRIRVSEKLQGEPFLKWYKRDLFEDEDKVRDEEEDIQKKKDREAQKEDVKDN